MVHLLHRSYGVDAPASPQGNWEPRVVKDEVGRCSSSLPTNSALTLLVGRLEGHLAYR